jgi:spore maturation protein CgeB
MKFLIADTYYPAFLETLYARHPDLSSSPFATQWRLLMDQCFGIADFYSANLNALGHEATEVVANCEALQLKWAEEQDVKLPEPGWRVGLKKGFLPWPQRVQSTDWVYQVLLAQVRHHRPDVLFIQNMNGTSSAFLQDVRPYVRLIVGQIACPISPTADFRSYDLILSSFPHFVEQFNREGLASEYFNLGFEPRLLAYLKKEESQYQTVFVGGLTAQHMERIRLLSQISTAHLVDLWGYGIDTLEPKSPLHASYHGQAWGLDMYNILYNSNIALNNHINVAGAFANNMRLYEATGVGTLLITDYKDNLHTLFEPGSEVIAYSSAEECVELVAYYLAHEEERQAIARAGQQRTLQEHSYLQRMQELVNVIERQLHNPRRGARIFFL